MARISNDHSLGLRTGMQENVQKGIGRCERRGVGTRKRERKKEGKSLSRCPFSVCPSYFLIPVAELTGSVSPTAFAVPTARRRTAAVTITFIESGA